PSPRTRARLTVAKSPPINALAVGSEQLPHRLLLRVSRSASWPLPDGQSRKTSTTNHPRGHDPRARPCNRGRSRRTSGHALPGTRPAVAPELSHHGPCPAG